MKKFFLSFLSAFLIISSVSPREANLEKPARSGAVVYAKHPNNGRIMFLVGSKKGRGAQDAGVFYSNKETTSPHELRENAIDALNQQTCFFFASYLDKKAGINKVGDLKEIKAAFYDKSHSEPSEKLQDSRFPFRLRKCRFIDDECGKGEMRLFFIEIPFSVEPPYKNKDEFFQELQARRIGQRRGWLKQQKAIDENSEAYTYDYFNWVYADSFCKDMRSGISKGFEYAFPSGNKPKLNSDTIFHRVIWHNMTNGSPVLYKILGLPLPKLPGQEQTYLKPEGCECPGEICKGDELKLFLTWFLCSLMEFCKEQQKPENLEGDTSK